MNNGMPDGRSMSDEQLRAAKEHALQLHADGVGVMKIAQLVKLSYPTVRKLLDDGEVSMPKPRGRLPDTGVKLKTRQALQFMGQAIDSWPFDWETLVDYCAQAFRSGREEAAALANEVTDIATGTYEDSNSHAAESGQPLVLPRRTAQTYLQWWGLRPSLTGLRSEAMLAWWKKNRLALTSQRSPLPSTYLTARLSDRFPLPLDIWQAADLEWDREPRDAYYGYDIQVKGLHYLAVSTEGDAVEAQLAVMSRVAEIMEGRAIIFIRSRLTDRDEELEALLHDCDPRIALLPALGDDRNPISFHVSQLRGFPLRGLSREWILRRRGEAHEEYRRRIASIPKHLRGEPNKARRATK